MITTASVRRTSTGEPEITVTVACIPPCGVDVGPLELELGSLYLFWTYSCWESVQGSDIRKWWNINYNLTATKVILALFFWITLQTRLHLNVRQFKVICITWKLANVFWGKLSAFVRTHIFVKNSACIRTPTLSISSSTSTFIRPRHTHNFETACAWSQCCYLLKSYNMLVKVVFCWTGSGRIK